MNMNMNMSIHLQKPSIERKIANNKRAAYFFIMVHGLFFAGVGFAEEQEQALEEIELISSILATSKHTKIRANLQQKVQQLNVSKRLAFKETGRKQELPMVLIDAVAKGNPNRLLKDLLALGLKSESVYKRIISGRLPIDVFDKLDALSSLNEVKLSQIITVQGSVQSKGDRAQKSDIARKSFAVSGKGITIGVLSDSYNCLKGAEKDRKSKDLPEAFLLVEESLNCEGRTDEGRALIQIIHDIAPQAKLLFHTGENGLANSANAILALAFTHKADIIVDDMKSISANFFQEDAITQAVKKVVRGGVTYVTAAGNSGRSSYQASYNEYTNSAFTINAHDFDSSDNVDIYQRIHVPEGLAINLLLQWATPAYSISGSSGTQSDLDIFIFNEAHDKILASSTFSNIGRDPVEFLQFLNPEESGETKFDIMITKASGAPPKLLKYIILNSIDNIIQEYKTQSSGLFGHANAAAAITVGAANYLETPAFGTSPPLLQVFSSAGGLALQFDEKGQVINNPTAPQKPDVIAPDNVNTTFFWGIESDSDKDGKPNISGTSASAPHVAGVIALLLESNNKLQPSDIKKILQQTAVDIVARNDSDQTATGDGFDFDSGYGLIDAEAAVNLAKDYVASDPLSVADEDRNRLVINDPTQVSSGGFEPFTLLLILAYICLVLKRRKAKSSFA